jgi:hypothetical protein
MPLGRLSIRIDPVNPRHHLWCNNGSWWIAYVLHFDGRKRRIRRSLGTSCVAEAIRRRDELLARIAEQGEEVPERRRTDTGEDDMGPGPHFAIPA